MATEAIGDSWEVYASIVGVEGARDEKCGQQYHLKVSNPEDPKHNMAGKRPWNS